MIHSHALTAFIFNILWFTNAPQPNHRTEFFNSRIVTIYVIPVSLARLGSLCSQLIGREIN